MQIGASEGGGSHGPNQVTSEWAFRSDPQQRALCNVPQQRAGRNDAPQQRALCNDVAQQWALARAQDELFGAQQLSEKRPDTDPSHIVEREPRSEQATLIGLDAITPDQVTRREGRFVRLAAVDQRRDRHAQRSR